MVHPECKRLYCHPNQERDGPSKEKVKLILSPKTRASIESKFNFQTKCFFYGTPAKYKNRKRCQAVFEVRTLKFQKTVRKRCMQKNDGWAKAVLGGFEYAQDLPAVKARYHQTCSTNFRIGHNIPTQYQTAKLLQQAIGIINFEKLSQNFIADTMNRFLKKCKIKILLHQGLFYGDLAYTLKKNCMLA